jgi:hypothetical protein
LSILFGAGTDTDAAELFRYLRHGRVTLFTTSHDFLQATMRNCVYVKQLLQRLAVETGVTLHGAASVAPGTLSF